MAQTGYTPILIYGSGTATNVPTAGNLTSNSNGAELAINYADGKLFYKDGAGIVQVLATKTATSGTFSNVSITGGSITGVSLGTVTGNPIFSSTGAITLPVGTTAQQPTASAGMLRFNSTTTQFEGYNGSSWSSVGGAAISNDTSTATAVYPLFASSTSGTALTVYTSNAKLLYTPSTGTFASTVFSGAGTGLTGTATGLSIGGTAVNVAGGAANQIAYQTATNVTGFVATPTVTGNVLTWNGTNIVWATASNPSASYVRTSITATGGQTVFTVTYTVGFVQVYVNGVLLNASDYTASNGTSVTLTTAAGAGDIVEFIAYTTGLVAASSISLPMSALTSSNTSNFQIGSTLSFSDTGITNNIVGNTNSYLQAVLQNTNAGAAASAEYIVYNNNGTASTNFATFGINSSGYTGTGSINAAGYGYFLSGSTDIVVGTIGANSIHLTTNSQATDAVTIGTANQVAFNGSYGTSGQVLTSAGSGAAPTWSTNISGTAANANAIANTGGWAVTPSGTKLNFSYNGTTVASLDSSGNFIAKANVTAYGTP